MSVMHGPLTIESKVNVPLHPGDFVPVATSDLTQLVTELNAVTLPGAYTLEAKKNVGDKRTEILVRVTYQNKHGD